MDEKGLRNFLLTHSKIEENFINQNTDLKNPIDLLKNLPFFRLIKKNIFK